jgi:hypothetical protein
MTENSGSHSSLSITVQMFWLIILVCLKLAILPEIFLGKVVGT